MLRVVLILACLEACGDNRAKPVDAPAPDSLGSCGVHGTHLALQPVAQGCESDGAPKAPRCIAGVSTLVTAPRGDSRQFVLELHGRIRIIEGGVLRESPFLDLTAEAGGPVNGVGVVELGLLGLAFHPHYASNRTFFVDYTMDNPDRGDTLHPYLDVIARYTTSATNPDVADPTSGVVVLAVPDTWSNHNGGMIEFGADGYLYASIGDGGGTSPADNGEINAQDTHAMFGKIWRIDVDHKDPGKEYAVPADNPFADGTAGAREVFMFGLRNPWRWSFDPANGDMYIGDVGDSHVEELDYVKAGEQAGRNFGWPMYEGDSCFHAPCDSTGKTFPIAFHMHAEGWWSIIGGQVYRGSCYPDLVGTYLFTDCGAGQIWKGKMADDGVFTSEASTASLAQPTSLHGDGSGELFLTTVKGDIFKIVVVP